MEKNGKALIVVDVQNDFCPGGALAVKDGDKIVPLINSIMKKGIFQTVIATQDYHPRNQVSFASNHKNKKEFEQVEINGIKQTLWPDHCVAGTRGAEFHPDLESSAFNLILRKGTNPPVDSYSVFLENDKKTETGLHGYLQALHITDIYICGLATDYCVYYSAMDALQYGFKTGVLVDACRGIDVPAGSVDSALARMKDAGIKIMDSGRL